MRFISTLLILSSTLFGGIGAYSGVSLSQNGVGFRGSVTVSQYCVMGDPRSPCTTGAHPHLFRDQGAIQNLGDPFQSQNNGFFQFFVEGGWYDVAVAGQGITSYTFRVFVSDGTISVTNAAHIDTANIYTGGGLQDFSVMKLKPPHVLFMNLPPAAIGNVDQVYEVTDCTDARCITGGGSTIEWLASNGTTWVVLGGGVQSVTGTANEITVTGTVNPIFSLPPSVINDTIAYCTDANLTDTYACNLPISPGTYVVGSRYRFKANTTNTGGAAINFNGLGSKIIKRVAGGITSDLLDGDILSGQIVDVVYDGLNMQMQSTSGIATTPQAYPVTFSNQLIVTVLGINHRRGTSNISVRCYDANAPRAEVTPDKVTVDDITFDVVIKFYVTQSGKCLLT